jgi:WD40 repeat protein
MLRTVRKTVPTGLLVLAVLVGGLGLLQTGVTVAGGTGGGAVPEAPQARVDRQGDPLPPGALMRLGTTRFRSGTWGSFPAGLVFLPDGKTLVLGNDSRGVQFWEVSSGRLLRTLDTEDLFVRAMTASPDGKRLALAAHSPPGNGRPRGTEGIHLFDIETGKPIPFTPAQREAYGMRFTPDGRCLVTLDAQGTVRVAEIATGKELRNKPFGRDWSGPLALSRDGSTVLLSCNNGVTGRLVFWDWRKGGEPREIKAPGRHSFAAFDLSPDGRILAETGDFDDDLRLWDVATGEVRHRLASPEGQKWSRFLAFSPDGRTVAVRSRLRTGVKAFIYLCDPSSGTIKSRLAIHDGGSNLLAFSADSRLLATTTDSGVRVWEMATGRELTANPEAHESAVSCIAVAPDGTVVTTTDDATVRAWDGVTGRQRYVLNHDSWVRAAALSSDGSRLVTSSLDDTVRLWDVASGKELARLRLP